MEEFINISQQLGKNLLYVQGAGGNSSVKIGNKLYVKASGIKLKLIKSGTGYACIEYKPLKNFVAGKKRLSAKDELEFLELLNAKTLKKESFGKPSMEAGFHAIIPSKYVFHLHSVYANIFNCMKYGSRSIEKICKDMPFTIIDYKNPGYELAYVLSKKSNLSPLIFLKNHGIIVHGPNTRQLHKLLDLLHLKLEEHIKNKIGFKKFSLRSTFVRPRHFSFPDSAVFAKIDSKNLPEYKRRELLEISSAQQYITETIKRLDQEPVFLSKKAVYKLLNMEQEKHRLNVFKQ